MEEDRPFHLNKKCRLKVTKAIERDASLETLSEETLEVFYQHVLRKIAKKDMRCAQMRPGGLQMGPVGVQKGAREGRNGSMGGQNGVQMLPLRAPNEPLRSRNGHGEALGLPRCNLRAARCGNGLPSYNLRAPRCGNKSPEVILGRILGAQKGAKMDQISIRKSTEIGNRFR